MKSLKKIFTIIFALNFQLSFSLSSEETQKIGNLIWQNEASNRIDLLVFWNQYEDFPSLGIGHFIWIPQNQTSTFASQFPILCNYLKKNGIILPAWLNEALSFGAPWKSREEFLQDDSRTNELRSLLFSTIDLQAKFMIEYLDEQWILILKAIPDNQKAQALTYYEIMKSSFLGTYVLVDYLNFKGSGLNNKNIYDGWGLLQVFLEMPEGLTSENINKAFAICAAQLLIKRIKNSYPEYKVIRFMHGWIKRISTYYPL